MLIKPISSLRVSSSSSETGRSTALSARGVVVLLAALSMVLGYGHPVMAQGTFGDIVGYVTDPSAAAVPDAAITITNDATGVKFAATTNTEGSYRVEKLLPGRYTVAAEKSGFKKYINQGVPLLAQQSLRVNIALEVGALTQEITVTGQASVINTETGDISYTKGEKELTDLPVISGLGTGSGGVARDALNFVFSMPGTFGGPTVSGATRGNIATRIDGTTVKDQNDGIGHNGPQMEATAEVKVIALNAPAEFDNMATILFATKGGTNKFHGDVYYEGQQRALNAADFFLNKAGVKRPFMKKNLIAFDLGGPIVKDKLFFFGSYERTQLTTGVTLTRTLPSADMRSGDFSKFIDPTYVAQCLGGTPVVIRDPLNNNAPFPGNIIPSTRISSVSADIQNQFYDVPESGGCLTGNGTMGISGNIPQQRWQVRADANVSDRQKIFVSYMRLYRKDNSYFDGDMPGQLRHDWNFVNQSTLSHTFSFSPTVFNEFKAGYFRSYNPLEGDLWSQHKDFQSGWGINLINDPNLPLINIGGFNSIFQLPTILFLTENLEFLDNLSVIKGKHTFKVGFDWQHNRMAFDYQIFRAGTWNFSNQFTNNAYSDFLLGYPTSTAIDFPSRINDARANPLTAFFQDTYQVSRKLTLTYGVRWLGNELPADKNNLFSNFDTKTNRIVIVNEEARQSINPDFPTAISIVTAEQAGFPARTLWNQPNMNIAPRFSFAYRIGEKMVLRGGYGIYYAPYSLNMANTMLGTFGIFRYSQTTPNLVLPGTTIPEFQFPNIYKTDFPPGTGRVSTNAVDPDLMTPRSQQASLTLERSFGDTRLEVSYVGSFLVGDARRDFNLPRPKTTVFSQDQRPVPNFGSIAYHSSDPKGQRYHYNALQVVAERRFKSGLGFRASYDWISALSLCNDYYGWGCNITNPFDYDYDYGNWSGVPRQSAVITYTYELPFGRGKRFQQGASGVANHVLGGWQINGITRFRTGIWYTPTYSGYDASGLGMFSGRPDRIADGKIANPTIDKWFDSTAFVVPGQSGQISDPLITTPLGRFGTSNRNPLSGPSATVFDFSLFKTFTITESVRLQIRLEAANLFNTPTFGTPNTNISDPGSVGRITNTSGAGFTNSASSRQVQFGAKFSF